MTRRTRNKLYAVGKQALWVVLRACRYELPSRARQYITSYERGTQRNVAHYNAVSVTLSTARCGVSYSARWLTSRVLAAVTFKGAYGLAATLIYYNCRDEKWTRLVKNPGGWHYENIQRRTVGMEQPCGKTVIRHEACTWGGVPSVCISCCKWLSCKLFSSGRKVNP